MDLISQTDLRKMRTLVQTYGWEAFMMNVGSLLAEQSDKVGNESQGGALFACSNTVHALQDAWRGCGKFNYPTNMVGPGSVPRARRFKMIREADESGVSGTGHILDGVVFHTGWVAVCWRTDIAGSKHGHSSVGIYPSFEAFEFIHIKSHANNQTKVEFLDD